jgi:hypothetical protein
LRPFAVEPVELVESFDLLQQLTQQVEAVRLAYLAELHVRGVAVAAGAVSTSAWLRDRHRVSNRAAHQAVTLASEVRDRCGQTGMVLSGGGVNVEQARVITAAVDTVPCEVRGAAEEALLGFAATFGPKELGRLGERIVEHVAPEVAEKQTETELARSERRAFLDRSFQIFEEPGSTRVRLAGWLDREDAAHVRAALDPLTRPQPSGDCPDLRTPGQRRADALVEVCRLVLTCRKLPRDGGERPQVVVTIDVDKLKDRVAAATLDDGNQVSSAALRRLACDAQVLPVVLNGAGQILDVGRERRLFTGSLRKALAARDKGCAFPACDRPVRWTNAHHIVHWADGGTTAIDNGVLLCGHHHRVIHYGD